MDILKKGKRLVELRGSAFGRRVNAFMLSPWMLAVQAALTVVAFIFALELYFYTLVLLYGIFVVLFADDLLPLMPLFVLCYVVPSMDNNPGITQDSIFYGSNGGVYIIILAGLATVAILGRIILDKNMGLKRLFCQKRSLLWGMLALGLTYMLSGIGSDHYAKIAKKNLIAAALQFASVFLLYFIFTASVDWKKAPKTWFAWMGLFVGYTVFVELIYACVVYDVFGDGGIRKTVINFGWGMQNNIGAMLAWMVPFPFYLACKSKRPSIFLGLAIVLAASVFLTGSRTSMLGVILTFAVPYGIAFAKCENKREYRISSIVFLVLGLGLMGVLWNKILELFSSVPSIFNPDSATGYNDSGRFTIYKAGIELFKKNPIFGYSFFSSEFVPYDHSELQVFSDFFPPRWHNTTVQILTCCGSVGMLAYLFHRFETVRLFFKKASLMKTFIGVSLLAIVMMSWLDCHFFNIGPTMFYSMALAFAEHCEGNDKVDTETPQAEENEMESSVVILQVDSQSLD